MKRLIEGASSQIKADDEDMDVSAPRKILEHLLKRQTGEMRAARRRAVAVCGHQRCNPLTAERCWEWQS